MYFLFSCALAADCNEFSALFHNNVCDYMYDPMQAEHITKLHRN